MERQEFKEAMLRGLGRAYIALKTEDKEKFRDIVQWGCLHSLTINIQSDGTLDEYMYRLVSCYDDPENFLIPLINAFLPFPFDEDGELFHQYVLLLGQFAKGGYRRAEEALLTRYEEFVRMIGAPDFTPKYCALYEEEFLCVLCSALLDASVERNLLRIATDLGGLCDNLTKEYSHFDWLYHHLRYMPKDVLLPLKDVHTHEVDLFLLDIYKAMADEVCLSDDEDVIGVVRRGRAFKDTFLAPLKERLLEADPHVFDPKRVEEDEEDDGPTEEEIFQRSDLDLEDVDYEDDDESDEDDDADEGEEGEEDDDEDEGDADEDVKARLNRLRREVNLPYHELLYASGIDLKKESNFPDLVECLQHFDEGIAGSAKSIFCKLSHKRARSYALARIAVEGPDWWTLRPLIHHYDPKDKNLLTTMIPRLEADIEKDAPWHLVVRDIIGAKCDYGVDLPPEIFRAAYELSLCRTCRYNLLEKLYELGAIPEDLQNECYYDGDEDIRTFAEEHCFFKKPD